MGVSPILELVTPWSEDELFDIGFDQVNDAMVLTHIDHAPQRLLRYSHNHWVLLEMIPQSQVGQVTDLSVTAVKPVTTDAYDRDYIYTVTAVNEETGEEGLPAASDSATNDLTLRGNRNTLTWTPLPGIDRYNVYKGYVDVMGFIGTAGPIGQFVDENITPDFTVSYPTARNPFAGENDKPSVVTFYDQRMILARTKARPSGVFTSQSSMLFNFNASRPAQPSDAITFGLAGRRVNAIMHLVPLKDLIILTTDAVWSVRGSDGYLSPDGLDVTPHGYRGCSKVRPVTVDEVIFFITSLGGQLRTLNYEFEAEGYRGNDLTVFVKHFFKNHTIVDMAWAEEPWQTIFIIRSDGKMLSLAWQREQEVWGWTLCETLGRFESVCVIAENGEHTPYFVVYRNLTGTPVRRVERLASRSWEDVADACYLDAAIQYSGEPITTFRGLDYLNGNQVHVMADGAVVKQFHLLENGQIVLDHPASKVTVGLPYDAWVRTLPLVASGPQGTTKGRPGVINSVGITLINSRGVEVGLGKDGAPGAEPTSANDEIMGRLNVVLGRTTEPMGSPQALYSGTFDVLLDVGDWRPDQTVVIRQRLPLPMEVVGIWPTFDFS